ncbi:TIGR02680 family protein, partial [Nocardiopsis sediminis]
FAAELGELAERKAAGPAGAPAPPAWAAADRDDTAGTPFYRAVDFADGLGAAERAGLEAALEAAGLLAGWITPDGALADAATRDLLLSPGRPARGRSLLDVLTPVDRSESGISTSTVTALLGSIALLPAPGEEEPEPRHRRDSVPPPSTAASLDGRWRMGAASGAHRKAAAEYIGADARAAAADRTLANLDRRIAIAEALLAEAEERRADTERRLDELVAVVRAVPDPTALTRAWAALDNARSWLTASVREHAAARAAAESARSTVLELRAGLADPAARHGLPAGPDDLAAVLGALERLRVEFAAAYRDLEALAVLLERYQLRVVVWEQARAGRVLAEDVRGAAIDDMITVRREIELTDRARAAAPDQIETAVGEVRGRMEQAAGRLPEVERAAQQARDDRVAAETRLDTAVFERAEQAGRALDAGDTLRAMLAAGGDGRPDPALLAAAGLTGIGDPDAVPESASGGADPGDRSLAERVGELDTLLRAVEDGLGPAPEPGTELDDSGILRRREELHRMLSASDAAGAWTELTESAGVKRLTVHDDDGAHDITAYAERLDQAIAGAEEAAIQREEEAFERHLLGELAGHLSHQIDEAKALISTMNDVLGDVTTSQGLGVRLDWRLAPDADEDIRAVVPLLARPAAKRTRVETTRLRDALRRCIEAIRRLDPEATGGAQLRAALDYRSWFAFTVYVTDAAHPGRERRLGHRTALSQGEQRVVAYLVLFAAAAAQFGSLAAHAPDAPRLILLDDAFAKVDEPTHGRLLGLLVELDLDFVLTSERVWGCFPSVPSLHIYECLRDPAVPGIATLHFTWDGNRRRLVGV